MSQRPEKKSCDSGCTIYLLTGLMPCSQAWLKAAAQEMQVGSLTVKSDRSDLTEKLSSQGASIKDGHFGSRPHVAPLEVCDPIEAQPKPPFLKQQPRKGVV